MTERYSVKDVRDAFAQFTRLAELVGFDTTEWTLEEGNSTYHRQFRHVRQGAFGGPETTEFLADLGSNAREAWVALSHRIATLRAVRDLNGEIPVSRAGVELPRLAPSTPARRGPRLSDYGRGPALGQKY